MARLRECAHMCQGAAVRADLITTAEAAALAEKSIATINRWAASGRLPVAMQFPGDKGARMFRRRDVERLAKRRAA